MKHREPYFHSSAFLIVIAFLTCSCKVNNKDIPTRTFNEFNLRIDRAYNRLVSDSIQPVFSKDFIIEDVALDPSYPRRFSNYSGDLSGRYIEIMSLMAKNKQKEFLDDIVKTVLSNQKPDGRFGDASLDFQQPDITGEHMALLWGNGRLLVGLMAYYNRTGDKNVLNAAKKLGDFYLGTYRYCSSPENIDRLKNMGAEGIICFTQYIEGMTSLYKTTGEKKYLDVCSKVYPLLPPRGNQHAHGYLTTLRGVLKLYEITGDSTDLDYVLDNYNDLVNSTDLTIFGSVMEFFGNTGTRDEGCATADFIRLSLGLYKITRQDKYLAFAENAMYNSLYFNQYVTGDFGHHALLPDFTIQHIMNPGNAKFKMLTGASSYYRMAAWWCCTMHGLRCLYDLKDNMISFRNQKAYMDLFLETDFHKNETGVRVSRLINDSYPLRFRINIDSLNLPFEIRKPDWADDVTVEVNDKPFHPRSENHYINFGNSLKQGDVVLLDFHLRKRFLDNRGYDIRELPASFTGYYFYGPFLMGIDDNSDPVFTAEPNNNLIYIKTISNIVAESGNSGQPPFYQVAGYRHSGFPSDLKTILRPVKDIAFEKTPMMTIRFDFDHNQ